MGDCARCGRKNGGIVYDDDYGLVCNVCWKKHLKEMDDAIKKEVQI